MSSGDVEWRQRAARQAAIRRAYTSRDDTLSQGGAGEAADLAIPSLRDLADPATLLRFGRPYFADCCFFRFINHT